LQNFDQDSWGKRCKKLLEKKKQSTVDDTIKEEFISQLSGEFDVYKTITENNENGDKLPSTAVKRGQSRSVCGKQTALGGM